MKTIKYKFGNYIIACCQKQDSTQYELIIEDNTDNKVYIMECGRELNKNEILNFIRENFDEWV